MKKKKELLTKDEVSWLRTKIQEEHTRKEDEEADLENRKAFNGFFGLFIRWMVWNTIGVLWAYGWRVLGIIPRSAPPAGYLLLGMVVAPVLWGLYEWTKLWGADE